MHHDISECRLAQLNLEQQQRIAKHRTIYYYTPQHIIALRCEITQHSTAQIITRKVHLITQFIIPVSRTQDITQHSAKHHGTKYMLNTTHHGINMSIRTTPQRTPAQYKRGTQPTNSAQQNIAHHSTSDSKRKQRVVRKFQISPLGSRLVRKDTICARKN